MLHEVKKRYRQTDPNIRRCSLCEEQKQISEFRIRVPKRGWYMSQCRQCENENKRISRKTPAVKNKQREYWLKITYGITISEYNAILEKQEGKCAICKHPEHRTDSYGGIRSLAVDHCHRTGKVRGLLCGDCNTAIGLFSEDKDILMKAIEYLEEYGDTNV